MSLDDLIQRLRASAHAAVVPSVVGSDGAEVVRQRVDAWLDEHLSWCDDLQWSTKFAEACPMPGTAPADYLQRVVACDGHVALVGIRVRGDDTAYPFVDVVAHTGPLHGAVEAGLANLALFGVSVARVRLPGLAPPVVPGFVAEVDQWFHAGWVAPPRTDDRVVLRPVRDVVHAIGFVEETFAEWGARAAWFTERVHPIGAESLQACVAAGGAHWVDADGGSMGLIAVEPRVDRELGGWVVCEEVVRPEHSGNGYGAQAQRALSSVVDGAMLHGTIDALNAPSLRTAASAGRPRVGAYWWLRRSP